ncbi:MULTISPECIES: hypothetical protein [Calothrix]|uniref:Uncharacterized protein n=2 Tax=Calothrix TaxID=1186 RepID=A0ABR8AKD1_9CYAN|nr:MULTISPECIES: hypothetical protein [Calothrix]MBD2199980.1 hypothetical protein [Calothrix parietina FACHB-288]MBD2227258.1 hypothetical protein [Calothrix anomala FACHB-343]
MIDDLPQLEPLPVIEPQPEEEREVFYPRWHCFCCQDSGLVRSMLVKLVMPNYDDNRDKWVACQNLSYNKFNQRWSGVPLHNFDTRFLPTICQKLDLKNREDWRKTVQHQVDIRALSLKLAMSGTKERTENDQREVQQRKTEVEAISHEHWMAMNDAYLGESA